MREYARVLNVARGTVQSRIGRMEREGVVAGYGAEIDPAALGYRVLAFVHLHLAQGKLDSVVSQLTAIPELLEAHSTTGEGDVLCRVVAYDNGHLEELVQLLLALPGVVRTRTEIALKRRVANRILPLVQQSLPLLAQRASTEKGP